MSAQQEIDATAVHRVACLERIYALCDIRRMRQICADEVFHFQNTVLPEGSRQQFVRGCIHTSAMIPFLLGLRP